LDSTLSFEVENIETLMNAKKDLEAKGLSVVGPTNHDDFIRSIYFFDPSGHRLELTVRTCPPEKLAEYEREAPIALAVWEETHNWSQREKAFGAAQGYRTSARKI
jgi:hypothetical protein